MRKLLTLLIFACIFQVNGQDKMSTYSTDFTSEKYDVDIDTDSKDLYIGIFSMGANKNIGLIVSNEQRTDLIEKLQKVKALYTEWSKVAIDNKVENVNKSTGITCKTASYFHSGRDIYFQHRVVLEFDFAVIKSKPLILIKTGRLKSTNNQYITHDGGIIVFSSVDEIDAFINAISDKTVNDAMAKPRQEDLFKH